MMSPNAAIAGAPRTLDRLGSEFDLVVVGSGAGSICAALVAKSLGRRCLILEKQAKVGGSTAISGGVLWTPFNSLMAEAGIPDSYDRARRYFDSVVTYEGPGTSPARREAFLKAGPPMVEFLRARGMQFFRPEGWSDYYDDRPGGEPRSRCLMAPLYDARALGPWASKRLARSPVGAGMPVHSHELPDLYLAEADLEGQGDGAPAGGAHAAGAAQRGRPGFERRRDPGSVARDRAARGDSDRARGEGSDLVVEGGRVVGVRVALAEGERVDPGAGCGVAQRRAASRAVRRCASDTGRRRRRRSGPRPIPATRAICSRRRCGSARPSTTWTPSGGCRRRSISTALARGHDDARRHARPLDTSSRLEPALLDRRRPSRGALCERVGLLHGGRRTDARAQSNPSLGDPQLRPLRRTPSQALSVGHRASRRDAEGLARERLHEEGRLARAISRRNVASIRSGLAKTVERWNGFCRSGHRRGLQPRRALLRPCPRRPDGAARIRTWVRSRRRLISRSRWCRATSARRGGS